MKIGIIGLGKVGSAFLKACAVTAALQVVSVKAGRSPKSCARLAGMGDFQITSVGAEGYSVKEGVPALQRFFGFGPFGGAFCLGDPLRQSASIAELCRRQCQI